MQAFNSWKFLKTALSLTLHIVKSIKSSSNKGCGNVYKWAKLLVLIVIICAWVWITVWATCVQHVDNFGW